ncbi:MAG: hypothetical protein WC703_07065 [Candidatus Neomarinimicrobiota bacterium]
MELTKQTKIRFYFHTSDSEKTEEVYEKLNKCVYLSWKAFNTAYNEFIFQFINREKQGENYSPEEKKKFRNTGYRSIKEIDIYSSIKASISQKAFKRFINDTKKGGVLSGSRTWSSFKLPTPIPFQKTMISIKKESDDYRMWIPYFCKEYPFILMVERNDQKSILDKILSHEYEMKDSSLQYDKRHKKWYINLCFSFNKEPDLTLDKATVVGVDLGVTIPVMCALNNDVHKS